MCISTQESTDCVCFTTTNFKKHYLVLWKSKRSYFTGKVVFLTSLNSRFCICMYINIVYLRIYKYTQTDTQFLSLAAELEKQKLRTTTNRSEHK